MDVDQARASSAEQATEPEPELYELPPELWPAWECFVSTWNQWRVIVGLAAMHYDGIDHTALVSTMDMLGVKKCKRRDVFMHVRVLESEAKPLRNQRD